MPTLSPPRSPRRASRFAPLIVPILVLCACAGTDVASPTTVASARLTAIPTAATAPSPIAPPRPTTAAISPAAQKALDSYGKAITAKDVSFHLEQQAWIRVDGIPSAIASYVLDISGADVRAAIDTAALSVEVVSIGDRMWIRQDDDWQEIEPDPTLTSDIADVFGYGGDPEDLVYVSTVAGGGGTVHRFRIAAPLPYQESDMKDAGIVGSVTAYEIVIDDRGAPLTLEITTTADVSFGGDTHPTETMSKVQITKFGEPITITPPA